jgi:hypothetical protein
MELSPWQKIIQVRFNEFRHTKLDVCHSLGICLWRHEHHGIVGIRQGGAERFVKTLDY